jgi:hypothetical membrane protein
VLFVAGFTLAGLVRPGYDPVTQFISDLGVGQNGWIQNANFVIFGALIIAFAVGLYRGLPRTSGARAATVLILAAGCGIVLSGLFTEPEPGVPSLHGLIHVVAFLVVFTSLIATYFTVARVVRSDANWRGYGRYCALTGVAVALLLVIFFFFASPTDDATVNNAPLAAGAGLLQRVLVLVAFAWCAVIGSHLIALGRRRGSRE